MNYLPLTKQTIISLLCIVGIGFAGMLGIDLHLASMPYIMKYMHTDETSMQLSISLFVLGLGACQLIYGPLSDKCGRKPVVIFGICLTSFASYMSSLSQTIESFLFLRFLQGVGSSACMGLGRTMAADLLQGEQLSAVGSYITMILALSPLTAPMIGAYIQYYYGWQANFVGLAAFMALMGAIFIVFCPETNKHKNHSNFKIKLIINNYLLLFNNRLFIGCCLLAGFSMASTLVYATLSPFIFHNQFHLSAIEYGWYTGFAGIGAIVGRLINPIIVKRYNCKYALVAGILCLNCASIWLLILFLLNSLLVPLIIIGIFLIIAAQALVMPNAMSFALSPFHERRGAASALYGSLILSVSFCSSALISIFNNYGLLALIITYIAFACCSIWVFFINIKNEV